MFHWPYYILGIDGQLREKGHQTPTFSDQPRPFKTTGEAEDWLSERDIRGNVIR